MSKKGPFDDAINNLQVMADRDFANGAPHRGSFRAAIKVLEAAGKVDKVNKEFIINHFNEVADHGCHWCRQIHALLESLPDEEDK
jgi:hypothetical protein